MPGILPDWMMDDGPHPPSVIPHPTIVIIPACEEDEQGRASEPGDRRGGVGADLEPALGLPPPFERARCDRRADDLVERIRRAVPPPRGADSQGPRVLR